MTYVMTAMIITTTKTTTADLSPIKLLYQPSRSNTTCHIQLTHVPQLVACWIPLIVRTRSMARVNLCFYAKIGLCFLLVSSAFLILMFSQEMRYQELINALKDENMDLRHGLKESDMISIRDKLVKQGLQLMKRDALIFAKGSKLLGPADDYGDLVFIKESGKVKRQIDIKEENDINGEKDKPNQDFSDADDNANEQGKPPPLVVDPKYVPDLHDLWFVSNFSIWENYTKDMFTESVEPEPELEKLPGTQWKVVWLVGPITRTDVLHRKISWSLGAARFGFRLYQSLWNCRDACPISERSDHINI